MNKKILMMISLFALCLSLTACKVEVSSEDNNSEKENNYYSDVNSVESGSEVLNNNEENENEEISALNDTTEENEEEVNLTKGSWDGDVYTNESLNFKFTLPDGWSRYSDEEIESTFNQYDVDLSEINTFIHLMAINPGVGSNIIVMTEKQSPFITEDVYAAALVKNLSLKEGYSNVNDNGKVSIQGKDFRYLSADVANSGVSMKQRYYMEKVGDYFFSIIVTDVANNIDVSNIVSAIY